MLEDGGKVQFGEAGNHLVFTAGRRTLGSKMVEGQFPSYEGVVAMQGDKVVQISREDLLAGIRRVSLVASERTRSVRLTLAESQLTLLASSSDLGEARESLTVEYQGPEVTIGFNAQYLQDFLSVAGSELISMELKNADSQGIFRPVGDLKTDHRYVVMPMRL
jgi:DNA polymerase-3 subunit beta